MGSPTHHSQRPGQLRADVDDLYYLVADTNESAHLAHAAIRGLDMRLHRQAKTNGQQFGILTATLRQHSRRFDGIDKRLDGMDARFDGIDKRLDGMDARFDGIDQRLDGMNAQFDGIDRRLDGMNARFDGIDRQLERLAVHLDQLVETLSGPPPVV
ncbi:hypothetical protein [Nocardia aurantia]|uniref:t-SNARE coiled-coil homology domain-containing protein n=1 Tax=Nocardia aurantia TaxID=2585199 RepID=A0A7K0DVW2_9NOCA|nr:hypothetical protein [Nocardia aurantia]MQY29920.1 hypothetical protein [Nocardia aurantia]